MVDLSRFPRRADAEPRQQGNAYDDIISQARGEQVNASLLDSPSTADAISAKQLSRTTGYAPEIISADVKGFQEQAGREAWEDVLRDNPNLQRFMQNPINAGAAKDDRPALTNVSRLLTADQANDPLGQRFIARLRASTTPPPLTFKSFAQPAFRSALPYIAPPRRDGPVF
jgi:hypothetical protein